MAISITNSFPYISVSDKEKDTEDYHLNWAKAIVTNTFTDSYAQNFRIMSELYKLFQSGTTADMASHLQTAEDGSALPSLWLSVNEIKSKVKLLCGELEERGYEIRVKAVNPEAQSRKLEEKERLRIERRLQPIAKFGEQMTGIPVQPPNQQIPQTDKELEEYMDLSYKDKAALIVEYALKFIAATTNWDDKRLWLFRDLIITNRCITKNEIIRGIPQARRIDPLCFIFDPNSTNDNLSDSTYFGEVEYMPLAAAAERYGLTEEEIKEAYNSYNNYLGLNERSNHPMHGQFGMIPDQTIRWFRVMDGTPRCLVIRGVWRDYKTLAHKYEVKDEFGSEYLQDVTGESVRKRDREKIMTNKMETWRQCTLVGGQFVKEWGECPNQARDLSTINKSEPPYHVWVPDFLLGRSVSTVEQMAGLQLLKDITVYNMQLAMARGGPKGFVYDMAMKPENMTHEQVLGYLKSSGILYINSKEYQLGMGNMKMFEEFDLTLSASIEQYINIMNYIDAKMDSVSGISPARQGVVQGASQAVGVTNSALLQSNLVTATYFKGFERFCSRIMNHQARLIKICWAANEVFAPIIGDVGIDFLKDNIDISLDEFDVVVVSQPPLIQDRNKLEQIVMAAIQSGSLELVDALDILLEPDTTAAVRKLKRKMTIRKTMELQQAQQQQEHEAQMQQQQAEAQSQAQQQALSSAQQLQGQKLQSQQENTLISGRVKLNQEKIKLLGQQQKAKAAA